MLLEAVRSRTEKANFRFSLFASFFSCKCRPCTMCGWMEHDKLLLNDEKTEFLIIGTRQQLSKVDIYSITVGNSDVMRSSVVKNLGVFIDDKLSMTSHINEICKTFYYLHNIKRIRKHLSRKSTETLIHAFVSSRLDYCNSLLYGLPQTQIDERKSSECSYKIDFQATEVKPYHANLISASLASN